MLGDVLIIKDIHKEAATSIFEYVKAAKKKKPRRYRYIIGISGESGSGKSEVSHYLGKLMKKENYRVKVIHTDNYYRIQPLLREEWRRNKGMDKIGLKEYDWVKINKTIRDFREAQECVIPCVDLIPEQVDKLITDFSKVNQLIIEGLYAIDTPDVDLRVFIDLTYHQTKMNQIYRMKEEMNEFRISILEREHMAVRSLIGKADLIINKQYIVIPASEYKPE